jgi:hypothetical protein
VSGYVYFITTAEAERVKIGFTGNSPQTRLRELQTGSPQELCIIAVEPGSIDYERRLHARFSEHRLHGEWFAVGDEIKQHIREANRKSYEQAEQRQIYPPKWVRVFHALETGGSVEEADAE